MNERYYTIGIKIFKDRSLELLIPSQKGYVE